MSTTSILGLSSLNGATARPQDAPYCSGATSQTFNLVCVAGDTIIIATGNNNSASAVAPTIKDPSNTTVSVTTIGSHASADNNSVGLYKATAATAGTYVVTVNGSGSGFEGIGMSIGGVAGTTSNEVDGATAPGAGGALSISVTAPAKGMALLARILDCNGNFIPSAGPQPGERMLQQTQSFRSLQLGFMTSVAGGVLALGSPAIWEGTGGGTAVGYVGCGLV